MMKKLSIFARFFMPLSILEIYYRERRKERFEQGKNIKYINFRERLYPIFIKFLAIDRFFRKQTITVIGNQKKYSEPAIYACTHIGENDLENIYEAIKRGCWWFVGDPCVLYKDISGLLLYLNGCILVELGDKVDRRIAYLRAVELLNAGGSLMIFPEGARNGMENLPVMALYQGTAKMSMETNTKIIPIAIEQYDKRFVINFGDELFPGDFYESFELTQKLRDDLATLKWEIWEREGLCSRASLPDNYREQFKKEFKTRIYPYDTLESVERTRFHTKEEIEQRDALAYLDMLIPCKGNAFLFKS